MAEFLWWSRCKRQIYWTRNAWSYCYNQPHIVQIETTNLCNLHCKWCYRNNESMHKFGFGSMNIMQFKEVVRQLKGAKTLFVHGWGEPLLYSDLIEAIDYSKEFIPRISMVTNATLLNEDMAHKLSKSRLTDLNVSIDATDKQTFEDIRGCDFEEVIHNVKYFRQCSDIPIYISSVVSRQNMKSLIDMPQLARDLGASLITFLPLNDTDASRKHNSTRVTFKKELADFVNRVRKNARRASIRTNVSSLMQDNHVMCLYPFNYPYINFRGFLTPCCNWPDLNLCSVLENGFENAWHSSQMRSFREDLLANRYPERCKDECQVCQLGAMFSRFS